MAKAQLAIGVLVSLGLWAALTGHAATQSDAAAVCGDPETPPDKAIISCNNALDDRYLARGVRARILANRGSAWLDLGKNLSALSDFEDALAIEPTMFVAMTGRARALTALGQWEAGISQFDAALAQSPRDVNALMGRGAAHLSTGNAAAALADFDTALRVAPKDLDARYNRGAAKMALGDKTGAAADFTEVIRSAPDDAGAHLMRARTRVGSMDPLALADYQRAVALDPEWGQAWFERGRQFDRMGRIEEANRDFRRAYELGHQDPWLQERILSMGR